MDASTRRLRHFVELAKTTNFTRAAENMFVSQQGLSRSIAELEREVGLTLVNRTTRSVELTAAGESFLQVARRTLEVFDSGVSEIRQHYGAERRIVRLGFTASSALELTPLILQEFTQSHPDVEIQLKSFDWSDPTCGLATGESDIAFLRTPVKLEGLSSAELFCEPRVVGFALDHPLSALHHVRLNDLLDFPVAVATSGQEDWRDFWTLRDLELEEARLPPLGPSASSMEAELELVAAGTTTTISVKSAARYAPRTSIGYRVIEDVPGSALVVAWRPPAPSVVLELARTAIAVRDNNRDLVDEIEAPYL